MLWDKVTSLFGGFVLHTSMVPVTGLCKRLFIIKLLLLSHDIILKNKFKLKWQFVLIYCPYLSIFVIFCRTLTFVVLLVVSRCQSWFRSLWFFVTSCIICCQLLHQSLPLDIRFVCFFINDYFAWICLSVHVFNNSY